MKYWKHLENRNKLSEGKMFGRPRVPLNTKQNEKKWEELRAKTSGNVGNIWLR